MVKKLKFYIASKPDTFIELGEDQFSTFLEIKKHLSNDDFCNGFISGRIGKSSDISFLSRDGDVFTDKEILSTTEFNNGYWEVEIRENRRVVEKIMVKDGIKLDPKFAPLVAKVFQHACNLDAISIEDFSQITDLFEALQVCSALVSVINHGIAEELYSKKEELIQKTKKEALLNSENPSENTETAFDSFCGSLSLAAQIGDISEKYIEMYNTSIQHLAHLTLDLCQSFSNDEEEDS